MGRKQKAQSQLYFKKRNRRGRIKKTGCARAEMWRGWSRVGVVGGCHFTGCAFLCGPVFLQCVGAIVIRAWTSCTYDQSTVTCPLEVRRSAQAPVWLPALPSRLFVTRKSFGFERGGTIFLSDPLKNKDGSLGSVAECGEGRLCVTWWVVMLPRCDVWKCYAWDNWLFPVRRCDSNRPTGSR